MQNTSPVVSTIQLRTASPSRVPHDPRGNLGKEGYETTKDSQTRGRIVMNSQRGRGLRGRGLCAPGESWCTATPSSDSKRSAVGPRSLANPAVLCLPLEL